MLTREKKCRRRKPLAAVVLALLVLLSVVNFKAVIAPARKLAQRELTFEGFVDEVQKGYTSDNFVFKNSFVNLNGAFARVTGRRVLNDVVRLENGMLSRAVREVNVEGLAEGITGFSDYLAQKDTPFLYIQLPYKESLDGQAFPEGVSSYANKAADTLLSQLSAGNVKTMDLRPTLSQTPEMLQQYFYSTDHHWNSDGAFVAFQEIAAELQQMLPEGGIDLEYTQQELWERHSKETWFLGSWGKRVGQFFGGTDSLIWYTPRFETEMSCAIPEYGWLYQGDFAEANIRTQYIEEKDYFRYSAYLVYIGGDYPLVQHRNLNAASPLKVLMLKDSFTLPLQAYLSTIFQEIDVIDPRYFSECTIAEYVEWTEPDVVVLSLNADALGGGPYQDFGVDRVISTKEDAYVPVVQKDIAMEAKDNNYNYEIFPLESQTTYRITFDGVDILEGETEGVGLRVYDQATKTVLTSMIFDLRYGKAKDNFTWIFRTPDAQDELQLLFYAGIYGSTAGNSVVYQNITIEQHK